MELKHLFTNISFKETYGDTSVDILAITQDSRLVTVGSLYIAIKGNAVDGHNFVDDAINKGAVAIVLEAPPTEPKHGIAYVVVDDTQKAIGSIADMFYGNPSKQLKLIGVTGTNGKTTTATLVYQILEHTGYKAGLISTVENKIHTKTIMASRTTPDPIALRKLLADMVLSGCTHAAMEVSSHALHQGRVDGLTFAAGIFTNLTQDHLDYHGTMENYLREKKKFFDMLGASSFAIINADDPSAEKMIADTKATIVRFAITPQTILSSDITGSDIVINGNQYRVPLPGTYNIANAIGVIEALLAIDVPMPAIKDGLAVAAGARGRFQMLKHQSGVIGIVDYAHTPDGVENVLTAIKALKKANQRLIVVIGCGGNRDTSKRSLMLGAALRYSDTVIGTSDNPRDEDPNMILDDMEKALTNNVHATYERITDRHKAINRAVVLANEGDIVALLGKGHEDYQEIKGTKHEFSDAVVFLHSTK